MSLHHAENDINPKSRIPELDNIFDEFDKSNGKIQQTKENKEEHVTQKESVSSPKLPSFDNEEITNKNIGKEKEIDNNQEYNKNNTDETISNIDYNEDNDYQEENVKDLDLDLDEENSQEEFKHIEHSENENQDNLEDVKPNNLEDVKSEEIEDVKSEEIEDPLASLLSPNIEDPDEKETKGKGTKKTFFKKNPREKNKKAPKKEKPKKEKSLKKSSSDGEKGFNEEKVQEFFTNIFNKLKLKKKENKENVDNKNPNDKSVKEKGNFSLYLKIGIPIIVLILVFSVFYFVSNKDYSKPEDLSYSSSKQKIALSSFSANDKENITLNIKNKDDISRSSAFYLTLEQKSGLFSKDEIRCESDIVDITTGDTSKQVFKCSKKINKKNKLKILSFKETKL